MIDAEPAALGVHEHVAVPLRSVTAEQPVIDVPPFLKFTVPVVPDVTVAVIEYVVPARGEAGREPSAVVLASHVATCVTDCAGRFVAPESTGVTRTSYCVPAVSPVIVAEVSEELAVCAHVVHVESVDFLYSTVKSLTPVLSDGRVHEAVRRSA